MKYPHKKTSSLACPVCGDVMSCEQAFGVHFRPNNSKVDQESHRRFKKEQVDKVVGMYKSDMGRKIVAQSDEIFFSGIWIEHVISDYIKSTGDVHDIRYTGRESSCVNCGGEVRIMPSREKNGSNATKRHFCSKKCYDEYQRKHPGKVWNKGLTKKTDSIVARISEKRRECTWTDEMKKSMSKAKKKFYEDHPEAREAIARNNKHGYGICGFRKDLGQFFRSTWEANFARMLRHEKVPYKYEGEGMAFDLGYTTYLIDFYLPRENAWVEVKGKKTAKWKMKIRVLKNLYGITPIIVDEKRYKEIERAYEKRVRNWEYCPSIMRKKGLVTE